jgi:MFS family permease
LYHRANTSRPSDVFLGVLTVLRTPAFGLLWLGGLASLTGDWLLITALPLVVYQLTGSTLALGATVLAGAVPRVVVSTFAGVFIDRWDRRRTMLVCDVLLGLGLLPLLMVDSAERLWIVVAVVLFESVVGQFYRPAEVAFLPVVVPAEQLVTANALNGLSVNMARLGGPPIGALLVALGGLTSVVLVDAASFLIAATSVLLVRSVARRAAEGEPQTWSALSREWLDGLRTLRSQKVPRLIFVFFTITGVGEGLLTTLFVPFATRVLHGDEFTFGALLSAQAVGGLVGSVLLSRFGSRLAPARLLGGGAILFGLLDLGIFYAPLVSGSVLLPLALMVAVGIPSVALLSSALTLIQTTVEDRWRGRVLGAIFATSALSGVVGTAVAGLLGDSVGIVPLLTVQGVGYVAAGALALWVLGAPVR